MKAEKRTVTVTGWLGGSAIPNKIENNFANLVGEMLGIVKNINSTHRIHPGVELDINFDRLSALTNTSFTAWHDLSYSLVI